MISDYQADNFALAKPVDFKGIVYVRLSTLPAEQRLKIRASYYRHSIIKILNGDSLMNDCMIYADYLEWHKQGSTSTVANIQTATPVHLEFQTTS